MADTEGKYKAHFRAMMAKQGYNSPGDIPAEKKKEFFASVDRSWHAKDESTHNNNRAQFISGLVNEFLSDVTEGGAGKALAVAGGGAALGAYWLKRNASRAIAGGDTVAGTLGHVVSQAAKRKLALDDIAP